MGLPAITQTWTISANNRASYTSTGLLGVMQQYLFTLKNFLKTTMGYTVKGSSGLNGGGGGSAAMDGVDRWQVFTDVSPRGASSGVNQAWFVLTDGSGVDILLDYQGSSDDKCLFGMSTGTGSGGLYVAAGTANNKPTATDEAQLFDGTVSVLLSATSADRVFHMWGSSDKKMFRVAMFRQNNQAHVWGVEKLTSALVAPAVFVPSTSPVWGYAYYANGSDPWRITQFTGALLSAGQQNEGGYARVNAGTLTNALIGGGSEEFTGVGGQSSNYWTTDKPELQGSQGMIISPITCCSTTNLAEGKLGTRIDEWAVLSSNGSLIPANNDTFGNLAFVAVGGAMLPWNNTTVPVGV